jgi:acyl-CoA reductase-like NAD-dependent aldehyde dehydrogenase
VTRVDPVPLASDDVADAMQRLGQGWAGWSHRPVDERAAVLRRAADALEARLPEFCGLLVKEAHKTLGDAISEVREAVDFCRYYAQQAQARLQPQELPGPTGERNTLRLHGRGVFVCISPWNFPLAIFTGQVVAALVAGNAVAAKPAEQTPRWPPAWWPCCTRPACRPMRWCCCTARARRPAPRWWPTRPRPACASPAPPRWPASSTARWPPRTAPSCR